jgi:hypothetical protein
MTDMPPLLPVAQPLTSIRGTPPLMAVVQPFSKVPYIRSSLILLLHRHSPGQGQGTGEWSGDVDLSTHGYGPYHHRPPAQPEPSMRGGGRFHGGCSSGPAAPHSDGPLGRGLAGGLSSLVSGSAPGPAPLLHAVQCQQI